MEQSSRDADGRSVVKKFLAFHQTLRVIIVSTSLPRDCILSQLNLIQLLTPYFLNIYFNVVLPSVTGTELGLCIDEQNVVSSQKSNRRNG
jgi:hypothetical protein